MFTSFQRIRDSYFVQEETIYVRKKWELCPPGKCCLSKKYFHHWLRQRGLCNDIFLTTKEIVVTYFWLCNQIVNSRAASTRGLKLVIRLIYWRRVSKEIWNVHIIVLWTKIFCYTLLHRNTLEEINQGWLCCANSSIDNDKLRLCYSIMDNDYDNLGLCWANTANDNEKLYLDWANTANNFDDLSLCCANMGTIIRN